jgi:tRNA(adenine34) deaminase
MNDLELDEKYMRMALKEARRGAQIGEVPVGAVLIKGDRVLAKEHNGCIKHNDPTAHAELLVLRKAGEVLGNYRLNDTVMYVTIEPCAMCISAMIHARVSRLVFGTLEPKFGAIESRFKLLEENGFNHPLKVTRGVLKDECIEVLKSFFKKRRVEKDSGEFGDMNLEGKDLETFYHSEP